MNMIRTKMNVKVNDDRYDMCDHLTIGMVAHAMYCEDDSFGPVSRYGVCEECYNKDQNQTAQCPCCNSTVKISNLRSWMPYDFDARAGDRPKEMCDLCWDTPEHKERMRHDNELMDREFEYLD